jgi:hypothetical protein
MFWVSRRVSPSAPERDRRSLPARSTRWILPSRSSDLLMELAFAEEVPPCPGELIVRLSTWKVRIA